MDKKCPVKVPVSVPVTWEGGQMMTGQYSNYFIWGGGRYYKSNRTKLCQRWGWFWYSLPNKLDLTPFCDVRVSTDTAQLLPSALHCAHGTTVHLLPTICLNSINCMVTMCGSTPWMCLTTNSLPRMRLVSLCWRYHLEFNSHFERFIRQSHTWRQ